MGDRQISIEHGGTTYSGEIMRVKSTMLGVEDHGIMSFWLHCERKGSGIGVGGYCLDEPRKDADGKHIGRFGTAYGLDLIMRVLETVGVSSWEKLPGHEIIVLYKGSAGWGGQSVGIAGLINDTVLILSEHADRWVVGDEAVAS